MRVLAVDWSGNVDLREQRRHIWTATAEDGRLTSLTNGRSREEVIHDLTLLAAIDPEFSVGFDFAFSFPAWFLQDRSMSSAYELWRNVGSEGETWLRECPSPFWGRRGTKKAGCRSCYRRTELNVEPVTGITPKSVFQVSGPGSVGTGSLRGMPLLGALHDAGFSIWPFDPGGWPRVVEIYPRILTGPVVKSDPSARQRYLVEEPLPAELMTLAEASEDAFDAAVSALVMSRCEDELRHLEQSSDPVSVLEGEIWAPGELPRQKTKVGSRKLS